MQLVHAVLVGILQQLGEELALLLGEFDPHGVNLLACVARGQRLKVPPGARARQASSRPREKAFRARRKLTGQDNDGKNKSEPKLPTVTMPWSGVRAVAGRCSRPSCRQDTAALRAVATPVAL